MSESPSLHTWCSVCEKPFVLSDGSLTCFACGCSHRATHLVRRTLATTGRSMAFRYCAHHATEGEGTVVGVSSHGFHTVRHLERNADGSCYHYTTIERR